MDENKPVATFQAAAGIFNQTIYSIGGYLNTGNALFEGIEIFTVRTGLWQDIRSLAYNAGKTLVNGVIPVITAMKVIFPGDMLVISYMDGGVGSLDLRTGAMILPTDTGRRSLSRIYAKPGEFSTKGAYEIFEDDEDVVFICVDHEFKLAKHIGVFFKTAAKDSSKITFTAGSTLPFPISGCSQVAIGKYVVYLNGYDNKEANWQHTIHRNAAVVDTTTGEYAVLALDKLIRYRYNAFSAYYNGYIYTFGGINMED
jgi:hypothetical protein